jgi:LysM repeat protein
MAWTTHSSTRRRFLAGAGAAAAALALSPLAARGRGRAAGAPRAASNADAPRHLVYVWQFSTDGAAAAIRRALAERGLGIVLKTHDGLEWMSEYDDAPGAVDGPDRVAELAAFFEAGGVPFHAWAVVHGEAPAREAERAAQVLAAGARSLTLDVEPHPGFWTGDAAAARAFGRALRRRQPDAWLVTSVDARPWLIDRVPLADFAAFTDELAPQLYWEEFDTDANVAKFAASGFVPGAEGVTPAFLLRSATRLLGAFDRPLHPIGEGAAGVWPEFMDHAFAYEASTVSVWRFGTAAPGAWAALRDYPPRSASYVVQPGDTLSAIAARTGTSVARLVELNGLADPNRIAAGSTLLLRAAAGARASRPAVFADSYVVQPGDSLGALAAEWGTSVAAIVAANGLADANHIRIGQRLTIP